MNHITLPCLSELYNQTAVDFSFIEQDESLQKGNISSSKSIKQLKESGLYEKVDQAFRKTIGLSMKRYFSLLSVDYLLSNRALPSSQSQKASVLKVAIFETPLGDIVSIFSPKGLCLLEFLDQASLPRKLKSVQAFYQSPFDWQMSDDQKQLQTALESYFKGQVKDFNVDIDWIGTDFQKAVWQVLTKIGYGQTISYKEEAAMLGNPGAIRAVGTANGQNKISIVVPCHRVIGHDGKLVGYGGGLARKRYLLDLESNEISQSALLSPI